MDRPLKLSALVFFYLNKALRLYIHSKSFKSDLSMTLNSGYIVFSSCLVLLHSWYFIHMISDTCSILPSWIFLSLLSYSNTNPLPKFLLSSWRTQFKKLLCRNFSVTNALLYAGGCNSEATSKDRKT